MHSNEKNCARQVLKVISATGVRCREGASIASLVTGRLATGAVVREISVDGGRLHFTKLRGEGPSSGWVTVNKNTVELLKRVQVFSSS